MKKFSWEVPDRVVVLALALWLMAGCALACGAEPDAKARARAALALAASQKDDVAMRVKSDRRSRDCGCTSPQNCNCAADCACPNCIPHPTILPSDDGGPPWIWDPVAKEWWRRVPIERPRSQGVPYPGPAPFVPQATFLVPPPPTFFAPTAPSPMMRMFGGFGGGGRGGRGGC